MLFSPNRLPRQHRLPAPAPATPRPSVTFEIEHLRPLLSVMGGLDAEDGEGWGDLRDAARAVIAGLVADGILPEHLTIGPVDPPARVAKALAAAWQHATAPWPQRHHRY